MTTKSLNFPESIYVKIEKDEADTDTYLLAFKSPNDSQLDEQGEYFGVYRLEKIIKATPQVKLEDVK